MTILPAGPIPTRLSGSNNDRRGIRENRDMAFIPDKQPFQGKDIPLVNEPIVVNCHRQPEFRPD